MYIADCKISMAGCKKDMEGANKDKAYLTFLDAWNTIKMIKEQDTPNFEF
jgi:hypothetical protein